MPELELFWNIAINVIQCYVLNSNAHWNLEFCTSMPDLPPQPHAVCCITHMHQQNKCEMVGMACTCVVEKVST